MGKKNMVMRRIAALLIVSLMLTSSAFTSLAATRAGNKEAEYTYGELQAVGKTEVELAAGEKSVTLEVKAVDEKSTDSNAAEGKATSADALKEAGVTWKVTSGTVEIKQNGFSCVVTRGADTAEKSATVTATSKGEDFTSSVEFKVNVKKANTPEEPEKGELTLDKKEMELVESEKGEIKVTSLPEGADLDWGVDTLGGEGRVELVIAEDGQSVTVIAKKAGKVSVFVKNVKSAELELAECFVNVIPYEVKEGEAEAKVTEPEVPESIKSNPDAAKSVAVQTSNIVAAVRDIAKTANNTELVNKDDLAEIAQVPEGSKLKLHSVDAKLEIEVDDKGNPVLGNNGMPVVVVKALTYDIGLIDEDGIKLPHSQMVGNSKYMSVKVNLPKVGIKDAWKYAVIDHFEDEEAVKAGNRLERLYSAIDGTTDKYVTIRTRTFSPFVMEFSVENPEPATPGGNTSSGGSSGGGSRRHVVGGGSSTNSYSMTGNWVMGANGWTFVKSDGKLATNTWGWINGQYYYFDANGNMMTGWQFINGKWYCLNPAEGSLLGAMLSGVIFDPVYNAYFYADASGAMVTGWYQVGANWYYFSPVNDGVHVTGALLSGTYVDGYYLGADGAWVPGN